MLLEKLCNAKAPSAYEGEVRNIIKNEIKDYVDDIKVDRMGNIIAHKKGNGKKIAVNANMDEIGLIITGYNQDGTLKFAPLGIIDNKALPCRDVTIGKNSIPGIIGLKPIHLQEKKEREKSYKLSDLCIDIGAKSKEEAKQNVFIGEYVTFNTMFEKFGDNLIKGKALCNRIGCSILVELLKDNFDCDFYGIFNVQGEIQARGAYASAYNIKPNIGIIIERTICNDMPGVEENMQAAKLGSGPVIAIMDQTTIYNADIIEKVKEIAWEKSIPYQIKGSAVGLNGAGSYVMAGSSAKIMTISVPCRYVHTSISVCSIKDYENTLKLLKEYVYSL